MSFFCIPPPLPRIIKIPKSKQFIKIATLLNFAEELNNKGDVVSAKTIYKEIYKKAKKYSK